VRRAAASRGGNVLHREMHYGDIGRDTVRLATVRTALDMLEEAAGG
jgi:nicotinamide-nucleotide amidase